MDMCRNSLSVLLGIVFARLDESKATEGGRGEEKKNSVLALLRKIQIKHRVHVSVDLPR